MYVEFDEEIIDMRYNFYSSENLAEVMDMSAMQKSASSLCTSPSIPFQLPGDDSPPYWTNVSLEPQKHMLSHKFKAFALLSTHDDLSIVDNLECVVEMKNFGEGICKIYGKALKPVQLDKTTHGCRTCITRKKWLWWFFYFRAQKCI